MLLYIHKQLASWELSYFLFIISPRANNFPDPTCAKITLILFIVSELEIKANFVKDSVFYFNVSVTYTNVNFLHTIYVVCAKSMQNTETWYLDRI